MADDFIAALQYNARAAYEDKHPIDRATTFEAEDFKTTASFGKVRCRARRMVVNDGLEWGYQFWLGDNPVSPETIMIHNAIQPSSGTPAKIWMRYRLEIGVARDPDLTTTALYQDFMKFYDLVNFEKWKMPSINIFSRTIQQAGVIIKRSAWGASVKNVSFLPMPPAGPLRDKLVADARADV